MEPRRVDHVPRSSSIDSVHVRLGMIAGCCRYACYTWTVRNNQPLLKRKFESRCRRRLRIHATETRKPVTGPGGDVHSFYVTAETRNQGCKGWHFQNLVFLAFIGLNHAQLLETVIFGLFLFHFPPKSANFRRNSPFSFFFPLNSANFPEIFRFPFPSLSKSANFRRNFIFWFSLI